MNSGFSHTLLLQLKNIKGFKLTKILKAFKENDILFDGKTIP